jgi:hypothetical protein
MRSRRFLLLPLALVFLLFFALRRYARHSPDPFSVKNHFPGWKNHPVVSGSPHTLENQQVDTFGPLYMLELGSSKTIPNSSMTAVLPVTEKSTQTLELTITGLLEYQPIIQEVAIICPESLSSTARSSIRHVITSYGPALSTTLTLIPCSHACAIKALIEISFYVSTDWTLFLDDSGLRKLNEAARSLLLNPPAVTFPFGLKGSILPKSETQKEVYLTPLGCYRPAAFLVPPFMLPSFTFSDVNALPPDLTFDSWSALGLWVSEKRPDTIGGVVVSSDLAAVNCFQSYLEAQDTSNRQRLSTLPIDDYHSHIFSPGSLFSNVDNPKSRSQGHFGIFFPCLHDLAAFSQVACALVAGGHRLDIFLYKESGSDPAFLSGSCVLHYHSSTSATTAGLGPGVSSWAIRLSGSLDVVIALRVEDELTASLILAVQDSEHGASTLVRLPREDLIYSDWMSALSLIEWRSTLYQSQ